MLCRVRPICAGETDAADTKNIVTFDSDDDAVLYLSNKGKLMTFELDKVFSTQATQEEVSAWTSFLRQLYFLYQLLYHSHLSCDWTGVPGSAVSGYFLYWWL